METIKSKKGFLLYFLILGLGVVATVFLQVIVEQLTGIKLVVERSPEGTRFAWIATFVLIPFILVLLTYKVSVSERSVTVKSVFHKQELAIEELQDYYLPGGSWIPFGGFNVALQGKRNSFLVYTAFFSNGPKLIKAIIEATYRAESNTRVDPYLYEEFGEPPYEIFSEKTK